MSNQPEGLRTPQRATFNIFDDDHATQNPCNTLTPCTRLSRMTIESQSNKGGRFRTAHYQYPVTNFNDKLMEVAREEEEEQSRAHPNLDMFLSADSRISMFDKSKDQFFSSSSYSEDEESDDGDLFSSSLCPMSSPERVLTRQSIFDDEPMHSPPPMNLTRKSIFDDDDDEEEDEAEDDDEQSPVDCYDPSSSWIAQIFSDGSSTSSSISNTTATTTDEDNDEDDDENRPPRLWNNTRQKEDKKTRRTLPHEEDNNANERLPLREIRFEDYLSDDDNLPAKKKLVLGNGKAHKMRFMRTLSPPRYAKRKESILTTASTL